MSNATIIKQLARLQTALSERAALWNPTFVVLQSAEEIAWKQFMAVSTLRKEYAVNDRGDKKKAVKAAWANTTVFANSAWLFLGTLTVGVGRGMAYFKAIANHMHGRQPTNHMADRDDQLAGRPVYWGLSGFHELRSRFAKDLHWLNVDMQRLRTRLEAEKTDLPADHAANALAAMLFSPLLYPPDKFPDVDKLALGMEWTMWVAMVPFVTEELALDRGREKARGVTIVDINGMIARLWHIIRNGAPGVIVPEPMKNPDQFRRDLLEGRFTTASALAMGLPEFDVKIDARFPEAVTSFLKGNDEHRTMIVRNARLHVRPNDAKIAA